MSAQEKGSAKAAIASLAAGGLFVAFWLGMGVPLPWSAGAAAAAYGAFWIMLKAKKPRPEAGFLDNPFVDKELAASTVTRGRAAARELKELGARFGKEHPAGPRFLKLAELLDAIATDVESDPKDAPAAMSFLGFHGEATVRLARLALHMEERGASGEQRRTAQEHLGKTLARLQAAYEQHLAHLQEDNMAELQAELEVLEQSLGWDKAFEEELQAFPSGKSPKETPGTLSPPRSGTAQ